jgi:hypothetical protein
MSIYLRYLGIVCLLPFLIVGVLFGLLALLSLVGILTLSEDL